MILFNLLLNKISPHFKNEIIDFIKSLKSDILISPNEWDQFAVKMLYSIFSIED